MIKMVENNKTKKKYKYKFIQFSVSEDLRKDIDIYTEKSTFNTISDFVRNAVEEKIRKLKNPEQLKSKTSEVNPAMMEQYLKNSQKYISLEGKILERMKIFDEMKADLDLIKKYSIKQGLTAETKKIMNLLKAHQSLTIKQIIDKTNFDKDLIFQIVSSDKKFKLNMNGRMELT